MILLDMNKAELKKLIITSLEEQGFIVNNDRIELPPNLEKNQIRKLHEAAVRHKRESANIRLIKKEEDLIRYIANGNEINPEKINPSLVKVTSGTIEELLFRYASLHWSIPVSSGYGRRLRFIVMDSYHEKLIGLIGLGDPVYSLKARDTWIGWNNEEKKQRLRYVMDAFVLGAVPPYSYLLCGKLVAMLAASNEVREMFREQYGGKQSVIQNRTHDGSLAMLTTTSALGRSSIYNRLKYNNRHLYHKVGFTKGFGEFHFLTNYTMRSMHSLAKHANLLNIIYGGEGFRNRREIVGKCLKALGLSANWLNHGIQRNYVVPLAENTRNFLKGYDTRLNEFDQSVDDLFDFLENDGCFRAIRDKRY